MSTTARSLLHTEAQARAAAIRDVSVFVELDLTARGGDEFGSRTTLRFTSATEESFVDFKGRTLVSATLNGAPLDPDAWRGGRIAVVGLQPENILVVEGVMAYSSDGEGLHRHVDPAD